MNDKFYISIGIPAYNEEANIGHLIHAILKQKQDGFLLKEIIVISDGSNDKTIEIMKTINDSRIITIDSKERKGKAKRLNEINDMFTGDILVLLDADIFPADNLFLKNIVSPIQKDEEVGLVGCENLPLESGTFFGRVIAFSTEFKNSVYKKWKGGNNIYMCSGAARAFSRDFVKKIQWQSFVGEDAYSYFECIIKGYTFTFSETAKIYIKSPENFKDHMKQSARFINSKSEFRGHFSKDLIDKSYDIPNEIFKAEATAFFLKNPIMFTSYLAIYLYIKYNPQRRRYSNNIWNPSTSSKSLINTHEN